MANAKKEKFNELEIYQLTKTINQAVEDWITKTGKNIHPIHALNLYKKVNKPVKNETKALSYQELYNKDLSNLEIMILDALQEESYTRKELAQKTGIALETLTGIIANTMLPNGWVCADGKRRCRVTGNLVEELFPTKRGMRQLYNYDKNNKKAS